MKVRYCRSCEDCTDEEYESVNQYKSKPYEYSDDTPSEKIMFDSGCWTIDVEEQTLKKVIAWSYEYIEGGE